MTALITCYGSLQEPNFSKVSELLRRGAYLDIRKEFLSHGIHLTNITDINDDVCLRLVLDRSEDQCGLALSVFGPFAALLWQNAEKRHVWVTQSDNARTPLGRLVAETVQRAGFQLRDRQMVSRTVK